MSIIHKLFCVIGRTAVGKSTITHEVAKKMGLRVLKSYTTRAMRQNETEEKSDHTFISPDEVEQYRDDMVAYTDRVGYCSFMTKQQIMESDLCIINPSEFYELKLKTKDLPIELVPIYITVPYSVNMANAKSRGNVEEWKLNYEKENAEFSDFEKSNMIYYRILNDTSIDHAVAKMTRILEKKMKQAKCEKLA